MNGVAGEAFDAVEGVGNQLGSFGQAGQDLALLLRKRLEGDVALARRVHDHVHASLTKRHFSICYSSKEPPIMNG